MGRNVARFFITLVGLFVGPGIAALVFGLFPQLKVNIDTVLKDLNFLVFVASGVVSGIIFLILSKPIVTGILHVAKKMDKRLAKLPASIVLPALIGLIAGLVVAYLLSQLVNSIIALGWLSGIIDVIIYIVCAYLGISILIRHRPEMAEAGFFRKHKYSDKPSDPEAARPKLLDTSVIIDGRIFDMCSTNCGISPTPRTILKETGEEGASTC